MLKESEECDYVIVNNFKVFVGLPVICKSTMTLKRTNKIKELSVEWTQELKNNEEFEGRPIAVYIHSWLVLVKNQGLNLKVFILKRVLKNECVDPIKQFLIRRFFPAILHQI